jgi:hypothetical protein
VYKDNLVGFGDFDAVGGGEYVGAFEKLRGDAPPVKIKAYPARKQNSDTRTHGKVLKTARNVLNRGVRSTMIAVARIAAKPMPTKAAVAATRAVMAKPAVRAAFAARPGPVTARKVLSSIGAALPSMPPAQQAKVKAAKAKFDAAAKRRKDAMVNVGRARQLLAQHAIKSKKANQGLAKAVINQKKMSKSLRTPKGRGSGVGYLEMLNDPIVGEETQAAFEQYYDAVGAGPNPDDPGYLTDGSPDPAYGGGGGGGGGAPDTGLDAELEKELAALEKDENVLDESGGDLSKQEKIDMKMFFTAQERKDLGGIPYDDSMGRPDGFAMSYGVFSGESNRPVIPSWLAMGVDGEEHHGFVWGKYDIDKPNGGIPWGDQLQAGQWNKVHGRHHVAGGTIPHTAVSEAEVMAGGKTVVPDSKLGMYGPVIGNPKMPEFAGLRMDDTGVFFWLPNEVPAWLTAKLKLAAAVTDKATKDAEDAAKKIEAAAQAKATADRIAAQADQDAKNALAETAAASEAKVAETQAKVVETQETAKQATAETAAQQALVEQQTVETAQEKEAGELIIQQARMQQQREQQFYEKYPEAYEPEGEGEYADEEEEGGRAFYEGGEPAPGGDIMEDSGGEGYQEEVAE